MTNKWVVVLLALVVGFIGGMTVTKFKSGDVAMSGDDSKGSAHMHDMLYEVPAGVAVPTLAMTVHEDPKSGYNIELTTTNFTFAPEHASTEAVAGEGHAHIYVDGVKINRVYGNWYHLGTVGGVGEHEVRVELSANDHSAYAHNGEKIEAITTVVVEPEAAFDAATAQEVELRIASEVLTPSVVEVSEGDSVRLVVRTDEAGDFHIAGYEIVKTMDVDGEVTIEFVADKAGRYNLELHPAMAMEGDMHMEGDEHDDHMGDDVEIGALVVNPK